MAPHVVAQDPEEGREFRRLLVPQIEIGAEGIGEHQDRRTFRAVEDVVEGNTVDLELWHEIPRSCSRS